MRYRAFLSYSHADAPWARWLLKRLEGYRVPRRLVGTRGRDGPVPARLGRVFRDRDELPSAGDLSDVVRAALAGSETLVVLCSPAAAASRWVNAEVEAFRALRPDAPVLAFIVDGPQDGATPFPPALLADGAGGATREPLAADARKAGDGRERALLKLVAGLLGVGYDALAQREAQRRHRRLALVAAASLAGMAIALSLATTAWIARNDAQRRQAQAEDIVGFMLGDLREKLATVGRLDLMRAVDDKATGYFAALDPRDLSDRALAEQARSLTGIGQVRLDEGNHAEAMAAFREAHARSTALRERAPADGQRLFDLAQAEFWIGFVALQQGRLDDAATWLTRYRDSAIELAAMDPANFAWQREVAYGHHNLAVVDERRGRLDAAEAAMRAQLALYRGWTAAQPDDAALRYEAANTASWLGTLALRQGRLAEADAYFDEQIDGMRRNRALEPDNARWKELLVDALLLAADARAQRGDSGRTRAVVDESATLAHALHAQDPANNLWTASLASARWWQARLDPPDPVAASAATALFERAHAAEPENVRVRTWLARALALEAEFALAAGEPARTDAFLDRARALVAPKADGGATTAGDAGRVWHARLDLLAGDAAARDGDAAAATAAWRAARDRLAGDDPLPFERLDPFVRALHRLGLDADAAPHAARLARAGYVPIDPAYASPASGVAAR
ncbi:hypothetical protein GCM10028862_23310 [Luteimonas pelagia]